jgi:hypothetical protein
MYADAMRGVHDNLVFKTPMDELTYIAELLPLAEKDWKTCVECLFVLCFERRGDSRRVRSVEPMHTPSFYTFAVRCSH